MHVDTDLSAYLDGELDAADRARVEAHLDTCERCRSHLSELRATASLIAALPTLRPARSLVPHVDRLRTPHGVEQRRSGGWSWLRPIRSFSALASGAFLFAFLVTAVARSGGGLGGGSPTGAFAPVQNAPAAAPAAATAAPEAAAAPRALSTPPRSPAPAAVGQPAPTAAADAARSAAATAAAPFALQPTAPPKAADVATPSALPRVEVTGAPVELASRSTRDEPRPSPLTDPLLWLGLGVIAAVVAIGAHWRLRRVA